jgi:hypothetical protein
MPRARRPSARGILGRKGALNRWGGDEFAVTLPDFSTEEVRATAERFRHAVAQAKPGYDIAVTTSIGVSASDRVVSTPAAGLLDEIRRSNRLGGAVDASGQGKRGGGDRQHARTRHQGTTGWQRYEVVLDVPKDATGVAFGILLTDTGQVWLNSTKLQIVGAEVPTTKLKENKLPDKPVNLGFAE